MLDVALEPVKSDISAPCGVIGTGTTFAVNHNADNALVSLRYALHDADIQIAEEPFESNGTKFTRGSFVITKVAQDELDRVVKELGLKAHALASAPSVKMHAARAARVAILHGWTSTQTEGWWRQAFDVYKIPYDYIDPQAIRDTSNLRAKYDVIVSEQVPGEIVDLLATYQNRYPPALLRLTERTTLAGVTGLEDPK